MSGIPTSASCSSPSSIRRRSSSPNIRSRSSSRARRSAISHSEFDKDGKLWFDTMHQGAIGNLIRRPARSSTTRWPPEYNDHRVQLNFVGLRHDVDGKVWTKSVGTAGRLPARSRLRQMGALPADSSLGRGTALQIYQLISDSQNNVWMAEFKEGTSARSMPRRQGYLAPLPSPMGGRGGWISMIRTVSW